MIHDTLLARVLLVGSEVSTADIGSTHAFVCHLEYNAKHCSAWIFLVSLFGKSLCISGKGEQSLKTVLSMFVDAYVNVS